MYHIEEAEKTWRAHHGEGEILYSTDDEDAESQLKSPNNNGTSNLDLNVNLKFVHLCELLAAFLVLKYHTIS